MLGHDNLRESNQQPSIVWITTRPLCRILVFVKNCFDVTSAAQNAHDFDGVIHGTIEDDILFDGKASQIGSEIFSGATHARKPSELVELSEELLDKFVGSRLAC